MTTFFSITSLPHNSVLVSISSSECMLLDNEALYDVLLPHSDVHDSNVPPLEPSRVRFHQRRDHVHPTPRTVELRLEARSLFHSRSTLPRGHVHQGGGRADLESAEQEFYPEQHINVGVSDIPPKGVEDGSYLSRQHHGDS